MGVLAVTWLAGGLATSVTAAADANAVDLVARSRVKTETAGVGEGTVKTNGAGDWQIVEKAVSLRGDRTAIVVCDMWDRHWCAGATRRVAEMAPRMNEVLKAARARGVLIVHCPSDTMKFYEGTPQRALAMAAPKVEARVPLKNWCHLDAGKEAPLPIDDTDGGCDDWPTCKNYGAWKRQIPTLEIAAGDAVTDSAEAYYLLQQRGIENVIVMGVHLNMCVLGRPFSIRQMVAQGKNVFLMRDLTDTMYNSRRSPYVPHPVGTSLMVEHVEKYWCPSVTSTAFTGKPEFRFAEDRRESVVFLIGEDEYQTWETLPAYAKAELGWRGFDVTVIQQDAQDKHRFPGLVEALRKADVLLVSVRRRALPPEQLDAVRAHLAAGKPLIGIRTASHAFAPAPADAAKGASWREFDPQVFGGHYAGHHGHGPKTAVQVAPGAQGEALLRGVDPAVLVGNGSLYRVSPLEQAARPLLMGTIDGKPSEPVAWTHVYGGAAGNGANGVNGASAATGARVFYTSLGHPEDFKNPAFRQLLLNAVTWAAGRPLVQP